MEYRIHIWSEKAFNGTVVNQALTSLIGGSLEFKSLKFLICNK